MASPATNPWEVQSETPAPAAQASTPQASTPAAGGDQWQVESEQPDMPDMQLKGLGGWTNRMFEGGGEAPGTPGSWGRSPAGEILAGVTKLAAQLPASVLDLTSPLHPDPAFIASYKAEHPQAGDREIQQSFTDQYTKAHPFGAKIAGHLQDAMRWLRQGSEPVGFWEYVGAIGEQLLEYASSNELSKLAGVPMKAAEAGAAGSRATQTVEHLKNTQNLAATLQKNPKIVGLAAIGLQASQEAAMQAPREAAMMGAQSAAHTGDPRKAAKAAALGAAAPLAAVPFTTAGRYLMDISPVDVTRLGETFPVMRQQLNERGAIEQGNVTNIAPALAKKQQAALPGMMRNAARRATANALDIVNKTRQAVTPAVEDASRLLPAPEGSQNYVFSLETPGEEGQTGAMAQSAAKVPGRAAFKEPQYTTSSAPTREPLYTGGPTATEGQMGADISTATTLEGRTDVTQAGVAQTTDPHEAVQWMKGLDDQINSPEFSERPEAEQNAIKARRQQLSQQLKIYYSSPYTRRFGAENIPNILERVHDFGDAEAQLEHVAQPVFQRMDAASTSEQYPGGEFSHWRDRIKAAQRMIQTSSSPEAVDTAMTREAEGNAKIMDLIDRNRDRVGMDDYIAAKNTWRQASRLGELHARIERMMNGITPEEVTEFGKTRMMKAGNTEALDEYLRDDTNRAQLEELLGRDGISNLKDITDLFHSAPNNRAAREVGKNVVDYMWHRGLLSKLAYITGGSGLGMLTGHTAAATSAAALGVEGTRYFLRLAMTNPAVGNMLKMAVRNNITPSVYVPLISRVIAEQSGLMQPPKEEGAGEQPAEEQK